MEQCVLGLSRCSVQRSHIFRRSASEAAVFPPLGNVVLFGWQVRRGQTNGPGQEEAAEQQQDGEQCHRDRHLYGPPADLTELVWFTTNYFASGVRQMANCLRCHWDRR